MSNQEAIALLRNLEDALDSYCELNEEGKTAFRMAIEALSCSENPNNSDCISRQAAIDAAKAYWYKPDIAGAIEQLPSAQAEQRWIPCSERLPENNDPVNVTWVNHNPEVYYADIKDKPFTATAHYHNGRWYWFSSVTQDYLNEYDVWTPDLVDKDVEITAWMPLPEPYREERREESGNEM